MTGDPGKRYHEHGNLIYFSAFVGLCLIVQGFRLWGRHDFPGNSMFTFSSVDILILTAYRKMAEMRRPMDFWKGMVLLLSNFTFVDGSFMVLSMMYRLLRKP